MERDQYGPGSAKFGNFRNYYTFYPPEERLNFIPFSLFKNTKGLVCLDVGCNTGELTIALHDNLEQLNFNLNKCKLLAVDIDPQLIQIAQENAKECIQFESVDVLSHDFRVLCDTFLEQCSRELFDIVFLFSVTMWIHLNYGDEGLKLFLKYISNKTNTIVLEPQPWKCYKSAVRRRRRAKKQIFKYWHVLNIKENIEEELHRILCNECSFELVWKSKKTSWKRSISIYRKLSL